MTPSKDISLVETTFVKINRFSVSLLIFISFSCLPYQSFSQTGVSDNRVSLPEGSGGVDGFSDNAQVNSNMGAMSFQVSLEVPTGMVGSAQ